MAKTEKTNIEEKDIFDEMESEIEEIEKENGEIDVEELCEEANCENIKEVDKQIEEKEDEKCIDTLARTVADFENFKKRVERDKNDMIFFLKQDIFKKILPSVDDLDRIIKATDPENTDTWIYEWAVALQKKLNWDLKKLWLETFDSIWKEVNPDFHDVMTTVPWKEEWIICDEFEKGYMIGWRVLRHAKVVVGA